jgi:hypothetical protein
LACSGGKPACGPSRLLRAQNALDQMDITQAVWSVATSLI